MSQSRQHRFLLDNDFTNISHSRDDIHEAITQTVAECPDNVTTSLICSGAGSCYWPSQIGEVDQRAESLVAAHRQGRDPLRDLLSGFRERGIETFITYRMNDVHNPTDSDQWNTPRIRRDHPDCIVGADEVAAGNAVWMSYCVDYSREDVRAWMLSLIEEQIELYGDIIDGFQLDWMRFPRYLSGSRDEVWEKRGLLTDFVSDVKSILDRTGRRILLSVRVPTTQAGNRFVGFDLPEWTRRDLIDFIVLCPFLSTEWSIPVADVRSWISSPELPIYGGFDLGFGKQKHFPESLRGACSSLYDAGVDGIYPFNFPCWIQYMGSRPYHWLRGLESPESASTKPLCLAVEHQRHRKEGVDQPGILPVILPTEGSIDLPLHIPPSALPARNSTLLVSSGGDLSVSLNDHPLEPIGFGQPPVGAHRSELFLEYVEVTDEIGARARPDDCRLFRIRPEHLRAGANDLRITNASAHELEIERINLGLW